METLQEKRISKPYRTLSKNIFEDRQAEKKQLRFSPKATTATVHNDTECAIVMRDTR
jgi:hypothetical protein